MAFIELNPELWNQRTVTGFCPLGRTYSLAAWTCVLAGRRVTVMFHPERVDQLAADLLGLTVDQAARLFRFGAGPAEPDDPHPTVEQLKDRITEVTGVDFKSPVASCM